MESFVRLVFLFDLAVFAVIMCAIPVILLALAFRKPQPH
jgi:hypothetical protein